MHTVCYYVHAHSLGYAQRRRQPGFAADIRLHCFGFCLLDEASRMNVQHMSADLSFTPNPPSFLCSLLLPCSSSNFLPPPTSFSSTPITLFLYRLPSRALLHFTRIYIFSCQLCLSRILRLLMRYVLQFRHDFERLLATR